MAAKPGWSGRERTQGQKEYNEEKKKFKAQREEELYRTKTNLQKQQQDLDARLCQLAQGKQALQPELDRLAEQREKTEALQAQLLEQKRVLDRRWGDKAEVLAAVDPYLPPDLHSVASDGKLRFPTATEAQLKKEVRGDGQEQGSHCHPHHVVEG